MSPKIDRYGKVVDPYPAGEIWKELTRDDLGIPLAPETYWERDYDEEERQRVQRQRDYAERVAKQKEETARAAEETERSKLATLAAAVAMSLNTSGAVVSRQDAARMTEEQLRERSRARSRAAAMARWGGSEGAADRDERRERFRDWDATLQKQSPQMTAEDRAASIAESAVGEGWIAKDGGPLSVSAVLSILTGRR